MEKNKSEQYTFGPDEKEILQKLSIVEASVNKNNKEKNQREVISTKYYSEFVINTKKGPTTLNNVYITTERNKDGEMSYHFRWIIQKENGEQTIEENIVIYENGQTYITDGLKDYLGDIEINIEDLMAENDSKNDRLKGISEKVEPEDLKRTLDEKDKENKKEQQENSEDEENQEIEESLEEQGEDLRISKYRKIKDSHISERIPEVFKDGEENGIAFSNKLNRFVIISKINGQYQLNENVDPARMTWKSIISVDAKGEKVERNVPHALMQIPNNDEKEIAVTIDNYGDVEIETVDVLPCQERIARKVREEGEGIEREENKETRDYFDKGGKENKHDLAHKVKEIEDAQKDANQTVDNDITPDDYIPNLNPPKTWGNLMEETGESLPKLIDRYNKEITKEGVTSKEVIDTIEYDYGNVNREHNH